MTFFGYILVFLYIFGWRIYSYIDMIQLVSVGFGVYALLNWRHRLAQSVWPVLGLFALIFLYTATVFIARGVTDLFPLFRVARSALTLLGGLGIAIFFERRLGASAGGELLKATVASVALHGTVMLAMYFSHPVRSLVYGVTNGVQYANRGVFLGVNLADVGVRVMGLTYGLGSTSVLQASAALQLPAVARYLRRPLFVIPLYLSISIFSAAIAGRSGLLVVAALTPVLVLSLLVKRSTRRLGATVLISFVLLFPISYGALSFFDDVRNQQFNYTITHIEELSTIVTAPERSPTLKALAGQFVLPSGITNTLFGVGSFGRSGSFYLTSDIGLVQHLFAYGVFGMALLWSPLFLMLAFALRNRSGSPLGALGFALTVITSIIFNGKEESLYERCFWSFQVLIWFHVMLASKHAAKQVA